MFEQAQVLDTFAQELINLRRASLIPRDVDVVFVHSTPPMLQVACECPQSPVFEIRAERDNEDAPYIFTCIERGHSGAHTAAARKAVSYPDAAQLLKRIVDGIRAACDNHH